MSKDYVHRISLFNLPDPADQEHFVTEYSKVKDKAVKDGEKYIVACDVGKATPDHRAQGFTVAAHTVFRNQEDFDFYDKECAAHDELRQFVKPRHKGFVMLYFKSSSAN